jgi:toxin ParE1/3/4
MESILNSTRPPSIRWTKKAFQYLEAAVQHVASESPHSAESLAKKILQNVNMLADHPEIGRPGRCKGTRELVIGGTPYIVPYRIKNHQIEILRVLHGAKKWPVKL